MQENNEQDNVSRDLVAKNCPNCGAPLDGLKCNHCGTEFIDLSGQIPVQDSAVTNKTLDITQSEIVDTPFKVLFDSLASEDETEKEKAIDELMKEANRLWDDDEFRQSMRELGIDLDDERSWDRRTCLEGYSTYSYDSDALGLAGVLKFATTIDHLTDDYHPISIQDLDSTTFTPENVLKNYLFTRGIFGNLDQSQIDEIVKSGLAFSRLGVTYPSDFIGIRFGIDVATQTLTPYCFALEAGFGKITDDLTNSGKKKGQIMEYFISRAKECLSEGKIPSNSESSELMAW